MERKKVKTEEIKELTPKTRVEEIIDENVEVKSKQDKWDKIEGIKGKIVRFKMGDEKRKEFLNKKNYKHLYTSIDGNHLFEYFQILD
jgi:hypothetical protein